MKKHQLCKQSQEIRHNEEDAKNVCSFNKTLSFQFGLYNPAQKGPKMSTQQNAMLKLAEVMVKEVGEDEDLTCQEVDEEVESDDEEDES